MVHLFAQLLFSVASLVVVAPSRSAITVAGIVALVVLILLSAFFASSEIAIFSLADHRIGTLVEDGVPGASTLSNLKSNPRRLLVTILVGNNVANIAMSSIATGLLGMYFAPGQSVLIATFGITSIVLLFGESAPKSYAVEHSEPWALRIARPLRLSQMLMYPLVAVFDVLTRAVNKVMGSDGDIEAAYISRAEIRELIEAGQREGVLEDEEHLMLQRLLRFRNRTVKETMIPRLEVLAVPVDAEPSDVVETCVEGGVRFLPVYEETLDHVVGIVDVVDVIAAADCGADASLRTLAEEPFVVPESKDVDELLIELRAERHHLAIVVDEFGSVAGIVTIEEIFEEIVGEILTETERHPIRWIDDDVALVRGEVNLHEIDALFDAELPEGSEYETVAGLVFDRTGRVVREGEAVTIHDLRFTVVTAENNRILEVRVERTTEDSDATKEGTDRSKDGSDRAKEGSG